MKKAFVIAFGVALMANPAYADMSLRQAVAKDYDSYLSSLYVHFHENPELSHQEHKTAARLAKELRAEGFDVTTGVGGTGIVAIMKNGKGPMVMMRADMDGLPVLEKSGLPYASKVTQLSLLTKNVVPVTHACGHDVHITSLVGTARRMVAMKDQWSGTLMLIGQPAEELGPGAKAMMEDNLWQRFGKPDYALAFHVASQGVAGVINVSEGAPWAGSDTVDIVIHGIGAHGASPHLGKDPVLLGSQIVIDLQTLVSRELSPRQPGVVTVGSFHSGTKHNIISDRAHLQITVRNTNLGTRKILLDGIKRIAENMGRVAGLPEDLLPEVTVSADNTLPPTVNNDDLVRRLRKVWQSKIGYDAVVNIATTGMGAEDFSFFTMEPAIPSVYFTVGGTPQEDFDRAKAGGPAVASHHSPLFKISPEPAVKSGVEATVYALLDLMAK
ncbi:MAG: peptidase M20 [Alphaproteobacteria bacterium]|nr:MAG: peptidase M20 [Alphaproteobacteria bacterium]